LFLLWQLCDHYKVILQNIKQNLNGINWNNITNLMWLFEAPLYFKGIIIITSLFRIYLGVFQWYRSFCLY